MSGRRIWDVRKSSKEMPCCDGQICSREEIRSRVGRICVFYWTIWGLCKMLLRPQDCLLDSIAPHSGEFEQTEENKRSIRECSSFWFGTYRVESRRDRGGKTLSRKHWQEEELKRSGPTIDVRRRAYDQFHKFMTFTVQAEGQLRYRPPAGPDHCSVASRPALCLLS